jgi:two-component system, cell cycle sensor histidine kinase PleC
MPPDRTTRSERILSEKLELLNHNTFAILANIAVAAVVAFLLADTFPLWILGLWLAAMAAVCGARLWLQRQFRRTPEAQRCTQCTARRFAVGTALTGLTWGAICLGLPVWGDDMDFILMAVTAAGMTAGSVPVTSVYYPSYLAFSVSLAVPQITVSLAQSNPDIAGAGAMMIIYYAVISATAWRTNRFIVSTIELRVDNQMLKAAADRARDERDAARTDKWSTLAQLSHELRTPLNAILGFSEAMCSEIFGPLGHSRYKEYAEHVYTSGRDLLTVAEELLTLSQGEAGTLVLKEEDVDIAAMIRGLVDQMAANAGRAGLALQAYISPHLPMLKGDQAKLRQILLNLIGNALKFTPNGGDISITAKVHGGIVVEVRDSGIGMRADQIPRALEPFGRAATPLADNTAGAGLGLPICKRLAELHGARFSIDSELGHGTRCTLIFPAERILSEADAAAA